MDTPTLLALAQNAVDVGNIKAACEFYELALQASPNNDEVLEAYAEIMIHYAQDISRAKEMLSHAISVNPSSGFVKYLNLAQLSEGQEALQCYTKAYELANLELNHTRKKQKKKSLQESLSTICCAVAELYLTDLCFAENAEKNCEEAVTRAMNHCKNAVEPHQILASLRITQSRPEEALASLREAVALTHHLSENHQPPYESKVELARLLMQVSPDDAFPFLLEVLQLGDNNPYIWFLLGETARLRKRYVDSARLLRRARVMLVVSDGDKNALEEVDNAIKVLVEEAGGPEYLNSITDIDHPNPIELLQPEEDDAAGEEGDDLEEPEWEPVEDDE